MQHQIADGILSAVSAIPDLIGIEAQDTRFDITGHLRELVGGVLEEQIAGHDLLCS
jgi:hypothetical protein